MKFSYTLQHGGPPRTREVREARRKGHTLSDSTYTECPELAKPRGQRAGQGLSGAVRGRAKGAWGVAATGHRVPFRGDEKFLELDVGEGCTTPGRY